MKKYIMFLVVILACGVVLMACGDDNDNNNENNNNDVNNEENNDENNDNDDNDTNNLGEDNNDNDDNSVFGDDNNDNEDNSVFGDDNNDDDSAFGDNDDDNGISDEAKSEEEDGERTFVLEDEGMVVKLTYYHEGDEVVKQTTENILSYEENGIESKEQAEQMMEPQSEQLQGYDGLTEEIDYGDDELTETMEIDYTKADLDEISDLPGMMQDGDTDGGISMELSAQMLLEQGFEEQ